MPNVNLNEVTIPQNILYGTTPILKVLNIIISEDQPDQYTILLDNGEKAVISQTDLTAVQAGQNITIPVPETPVNGGET